MKLHSYFFLSLTLERGSAFVQNAQSSRVSVGASASKTTLFADLLAEEGTWQAYLDEETTGLVYYFDSATGESLWEPPTDSFPEVKVPRKKQRIADELRREYRQSLGDEEVDYSNWFSGLFERGQQEAVTEAEPEAVIEEVEEVAGEESTPSWSFSGLGFQKQEDETEVVAEQEDPPKEESSPISTPWFDKIGAQKETAAVEEKIEEVTEEKPKQDFFSGIFGEKPAGEVKTKVREVVKKGPKKKEAKSGNIFDSLRQTSALDEKIAAKKSKPEPKKMKDPLAGVGVKPASEPTKKKDPRIGGGVKKASIATTTKKKDVFKAEPIKIEVASNIIPHPAKIMWGGEDAVFIQGRSFGVFDGVSGAIKKDGVALYSRTLANEMKKRVGNDGLNVKEMTKYLTESADIADAQATGASTAVVASIGENGYLQALNVGDSCCMVIRDGKIAAKTREISHYWECPYQLSSDSPDRPKDGTKLNVELTGGDIVLMGSDGIFDNVNDDMILDTIDGSSTKASQIAKKVCTVARKQSVSKDAETPYAQQGKKRGLPEYEFGVGGKVDDIGCVVVVCK